MMYRAPWRVVDTDIVRSWIASYGFDSKTIDDCFVIEARFCRDGSHGHSALGTGDGADVARFSTRTSTS